VSDAVRKSGLDLAPTVWASVMGDGDSPAQPWDGWTLLSKGRLGEVGAVLRFIAYSRVSAQKHLQPFSAVVACPEQVPLRIVAGEYWQHRASLDIEYPLDGTVPIQAGNVAATLVGSAAGMAEGYPYSATYRLDLPKATTFRVHVGSVAATGGSLKISVDGAAAASQKWAGGAGSPDPSELDVPLTAGKHEFLIESLGPDWIGIPAIDTGLKVPVLALIGRRNDRFIEAWIWNRARVYEPDAGAPVSGTLLLPDVPAGTWKVTWWDSVKGVASAPTSVKHAGGLLRLRTPPVTRHVAVVLDRMP
jgi:hypothetical protein